MTSSRGLVKASVKAELHKLVVEQGKHVIDACNILKVPYVYVLANISDPEIRKFYTLSKTREVTTTAAVLPKDFTPSNARDHTLKTLVGVGYVEKIAHMIAEADPETEEGQKTLIKLQPLLMKLLPSASEVTTEDKTKKSAEEIQEELERLRREQGEI